MPDPSRTDTIEPNPTDVVASSSDPIEPHATEVVTSSSAPSEPSTDANLPTAAPLAVAHAKVAPPDTATPTRASTPTRKGSPSPGDVSSQLDAVDPPKHLVSASKHGKPSEPKAVPRNFADLHRKTNLRREWFARIRIREDRLARLWVSNLAAHDVVVWSSKEKRWVALLAVPELRRALRQAEAELPMDPGRPSEHAPLSRPPQVLPPTPPLAMLSSAEAGVGEFRLRSIAQAQGNAKSRKLGWRGQSQGLQLAFARSRAAHHRQSEYDENERQFADGQPRPRRWHWRAIERMIWVGVGILAMLIVSTAGSMDEKPNQLEPAALVLTADRSDPSGESQSLGEQLVGANFECKVRPSEQQESPREPEPEQREDTNRELAPRSLVRGRPYDSTARSSRQTARRSVSESGETAEQVPPDLNFQAIRAALFNAAALAHGCPGERVSGRAVVTFEPNGSVRSVEVPLLIGEKPDRDCIVRNFKHLRVPPFSGHAVAVKKDF